MGFPEGIELYRWWVAPPDLPYLVIRKYRSGAFFGEASAAPESVLSEELEEIRPTYGHWGWSEEERIAVVFHGAAMPVFAKPLTTNEEMHSLANEGCRLLWAEGVAELEDFLDRFDNPWCGD
jgi:hypothetical protein